MTQHIIPQAYAAHLSHPALCSPRSPHWQGCPSRDLENYAVKEGRLVEPGGFDYLCANICHLLRVELPGIETALSDAAADRRAITDPLQWTVFDNPVPRTRDVWEDTLARLEGRVVAPYEYEPGWHEDWMCLVKKYGAATSKRPVIRCEFKKVQPRPMYIKTRGYPDSGYASMDFSEGPPPPIPPKSPRRAYIAGQATARRSRRHSVRRIDPAKPCL